MEEMVRYLDDFFKNKNVLVTGHTGFKGTWLLLILLKLKANVTGFSLAADPEPNLFRSINHKKLSNFNHVEGDIHDFDSLKRTITNSKPDIIFHLAAQPLVRESYQKPMLTWSTNVMGTLNLLESLKELNKKCAVVLITTDKVYKNKGWTYGYRENDELGGNDPYSASKAASEIMINSWRKSFCNSNSDQRNLKIATARAGNVIGGGDWAKDRIVPDIIRSIINKEDLQIRNRFATRPWQHVLEPLYGYLVLSFNLFKNNSDIYQSSFNFGPDFASNKTVNDLVNEVNKIWHVKFFEKSNYENFHEEKILNLDITKSLIELHWKPKWDFSETVKKTIQWYKDVESGEIVINRCWKDIDEYFD